MAEDNILSVRLRHRHGSLRLAMDFCLREPWTVLFGPSGSGKSTALRIIAGFERPQDGSILFGPMQRGLVETRKRVFLKPHLRPIRSAGQNARLFPGMRVRENVSYGVGREARPIGKARGARETTDEVLSLFRLSSLAERWPTELSGGERQRVSVARAVVSAATLQGLERPLLLLDEPFSGLDAALKDELVLALKTYLEGCKIPVLSVSHDVGEAFLLRAEVIRVAEGKIVDQGPVEIVLGRERERLLAGLQ